MEGKLNISSQDIHNTLWDVAVIGAGPAGTAASILLSTGGFKVILIDKETFPREKVCGDGLISDSLNYLKKSGLYHKIRDIGYVVNQTSVYSPSRHELKVPIETIAIKREIFDYELLKLAMSRGTCYYKNEVKKIKPQSDFVLSRLPDGGVVKSKYAIIATGSDMSVINSTLCGRSLSASAVALRGYLKSETEVSKMVISYDKSILPGYAWLFPLGEGNYNIGCGLFNGHSNYGKANLKKMFEVFVSSFPLVKELFRRGEMISELKGGKLRCGLDTKRALLSGRILSAGEAISSTYNYTGEGIGKALQTGELAGEVISRALNKNDQSILVEYPLMLENNFRNLYKGYISAQKWLSKKTLNDYMIKRAQKSPYLSASITKVLNEDKNPAKVFSIGGLLKSYLK